jgi:hypothetical protein
VDVFRGPRPACRCGSAVPVMPTAPLAVAKLAERAAFRSLPYFRGSEHLHKLLAKCQNVLARTLRICGRANRFIVSLSTH